MKTLGLLGGMSWESTSIYYQLINRRIQETLGGLHSARILMHSFDFDDIAQLQREQRWDEAGDTLGRAALGLQQAGADAILICTNTMHYIADRVTRHISVPLLHIVDAVGRAIKMRGSSRVALLGTRFTMQMPFYRDKLLAEHGITAIVPDDASQAIVHDIIYNELCKGVVNAASAERFLEIIRILQLQGAEGLILGCTEIGMLINQSMLPDMPFFDSTVLHADYAFDFAVN